MQLLLIELDSSSNGFLSARLDEAGFRTQRVSSVERFLQARLDGGIEALVLDVNGTNCQAASTVKRVRVAGIDLPLIVLSAAGDWRDKVACLDAGADDFLLKPVRSEEIAARVRALIRRSFGKSTDLLVSGEIELDLKARCAWLDGKCLELTRTEFRLLSLFMLRPGQVLAHREIHDRLYPNGQNCSLNAIEVQIARLRRKIGRDCIRTVRGVGYRFAQNCAAGLQAASAFLFCLPLNLKMFAALDQLGTLIA